MTSKRIATPKTIYDAHVVLDKDLWSKLEQISKAEERSVTATIRLLVREALAARQEAAGKVKQ